MPPGYAFFLDRKKRARITREIKRAILPRKMKRRPSSDTRAMSAMNGAGFALCPKEAPELFLNLPDAFLPWRKNRPARNKTMIKMTAGKSLTSIV